MQEASVAVLACSQCGREVAQSELVQLAGSWVCAECKPAYLNRIMATGAAASSRARYAGFWIRFGARIVDGLVLMVPVMIVAALLIPNLARSQGTAAPNPTNPFGAMFAAGMLTFLIGFFLATALYEILMLKSRGATLGKMACGLKVVRSDGRSLGWGVCVGRFFMWNVVTSGIPYLNWILMLVSVIMLGTDDQKRALHDRVCDTRVVYKQSVA